MNVSQSAAVGFLVGDVNNDRSVKVGDVTSVKLRSGQPVDATNFRYDINASGKINAIDVLTVKVLAFLNANAEIYRQEFRDDANEVVVRCHLPRHLLHHIEGPTVRVRFIDRPRPALGEVG